MNTKNKIIVLLFAVFALTYLLSGGLFFLINHYSLKTFGEYWHIGFTLQAIINHYTGIGTSIGISFLFSIIVISIMPFLPKNRALYGKARFASSADIKKMGLYGNDGIIIGKYRGKLLRYGGQQFVSLGAPTRSGKGVGIVIPNLLDWKQSVVVQDIKQECFDFTSKYRRDILKQDVYLFNPFDKRTHRYNPLSYIDLNGDNLDNELTDFANILYNTSSGDNITVFFNQLAQNLFIGLCYMCKDLLYTQAGLEFLYTCKLPCTFTLYGILQLSEGFKLQFETGNHIKDKNGNLVKETVSINNFKETYEFLRNADILSQKTIMRLDSFFAIDSDNTRSGVMSSFNAPLMIFRADNMRIATSANDFDFRDLRKKPMTIYVGITPDQLANAKLILNIFWQQLIMINTKELPQTNKDLKYTCMLLMDEFTASGYLSTYLKGISFIAGYGLRSVMIYQSNSQLETNIPDGYGKDGARTLLTNHACQIYYTPREQEDAEKISKMLGTFTTSNRSRNYGKGGGGSISDVSRALMLPQELKEMKFEEELISIDNLKPIFCNKAFYFNDKYFIDKFKQISPTLRDIKGFPNKTDLDKAIQDGEINISIPSQVDISLELLLKDYVAILADIYKINIKDKIELSEEEIKRKKADEEMLNEEGILEQSQDYKPNEDYDDDCNQEISENIK